MSDSLEASMMKRIGELKAENARLKAECQARQAENSVLAVECDSLKSEVERLTLIVGADAIDREHGMCCDASAQVERLTKAGDAMAEEMLKLNHPHASVYFWCKAKEGGQP